MVMMNKLYVFLASKIFFKCNLPSRYHLIMLGKSAICSPNLDLVERQFFSLVATLGNFTHNDIQEDANIRPTELVPRAVPQMMVQGKFCFSLCSQPRKIFVIFGQYTSKVCISCPYVTAVGGTFHINPEVAVSFSGGGFSRLFSAPAYQTEVVSKYLETVGTKYEGLYKYAIPLGHCPL